jgi:hypothetical protein
MIYDILRLNRLASRLSADSRERIVIAGWRPAGWTISFVKKLVVNMISPFEHINQEPVIA